ncbi:hypothetical protein DCAR_0934736 [Daucus carota subsp. sativus]|uniref:Uncharacterized protein n=1 Tax=Daucus carota subsp. sativus TaxID=79200 RepID=A0AAF1BD07_DAUCS|nr:hypothetical protein DCAR_0934736 [Daucus carota subsp. sativus]
MMQNVKIKISSVFGTGEAKDKTPEKAPAAEGAGGIMQTTMEKATVFGESAKQTAIAGKDKTGEVLVGAGEQAKVMAQGATDAVKNAFAPAAEKKV